VKGILADANIQGQVDALVERMQAEPWELFWHHLQLTYKRFEDVGLAHSDSDLLVWQACQREELVLITDNRNLASPESELLSIVVDGDLSGGVVLSDSIDK
jgi:hypothetical protein